MLVWCQRKPEEGVRSLETGVTIGCEPSWRSWALDPGPLEEKPALLISKPLLQPWFSSFKTCFLKYSVFCNYLFVYLCVCMHATVNRNQKRTCSNQFSPLSHEFGDQAQTIGSSGQLVLDSLLLLKGNWGPVRLDALFGFTVKMRLQIYILE